MWWLILEPVNELWLREESSRYFNTASRGIPPLKSIRAFERAARAYAYEPQIIDKYLNNSINKLAAGVEKLYGFETRNFSLEISTTHCILKLAVSSAIPNGLIVLGDWEFPGVYLSLSTICQKTNCKTKRLTGWPPEEVLSGAMEEGASVVIVSAVTWIEGYRVDLEKLIRKAMKTNTILIVDAVQHFGAHTLRSGEDKADGYAASVKKWLLAPHSSISICMIGDRLLEKNPYWHGLHNLDIGDWTEYWLGGHEEPQRLRRDGFKYSTPTGISLPEIEGARTSIEILASTGMGNIEEHNSRVREHLLDLLIDNGFNSPSHHYKKNERSSIILLETSSKSEARRLSESLVREGYIVSARGRNGLYGVRISIHLYNNYDSVDNLVELIKKYYKT